jgi:hypothetical protein
MIHLTGTKSEVDWPESAAFVGMLPIDFPLP